MATSKKMNRRAMLHASLGVGVGVLGAGFMPGARPAEGCETPAQTEGPFFPTRPPIDNDIDLTTIRGRADRAEGVVIGISGQVLDEGLQPVPGALVDIWQANRHGRYAHEADPNPAPLDPAFQGSAQLRTDAEGRYRFTTIIPGAYPAAEGWMRPPHIHFKVARRGFHELITQMYFAGEALNDADRLLQAVPERERLVVTLMDGEPHDVPAKTGVFNIVLQRVA
ncbi:MAG: protocatechuate 3,4-dioxygenase [Rhodothermales bacterium]